MKLSIVILNYKTKHLTRLCIQNIFSLALPLEHEIILVDNASGDGSAELASLFPSLHFIQNKENRGHAAGNNIGIQKAKGEYILILNPDIVFQKQEDVLQPLSFLDEHRKVGILGPRLLDPSGGVQNSCFRKYSLLTPLYRRTFLGKMPFGKKDVARHLMLDFDHKENREVDWILGACMFIRREMLENIGFLNEQFFLYFADYELCDRARAYGFTVMYFAKTSIIHYHKRESAQHSFFKNILSYPTRMHFQDWRTYLKISKHEKI